MKRVTAVILNFFAGLGLISLVGGWTLLLASSYDYTSPRDRSNARTGEFLWVYVVIWAMPFLLYAIVRIYRRRKARIDAAPNQSPQPLRASGPLG